MLFNFYVKKPLFIKKRILTVEGIVKKRNRAFFPVKTPVFSVRQK